MAENAGAGGKTGERSCVLLPACVVQLWESDAIGCFHRTPGNMGMEIGRACCGWFRMGSPATCGAWNRIFLHDGLFILADRAGTTLMACWRITLSGGQWERLFSDDSAGLFLLLVCYIGREDRTKVEQYSLGMKQKLGLAQAIMAGQDILILDEPFNALDYKTHNDVKEILRVLQAEGKTMLLTSHNYEDLEALCNQIYVLDDGNLGVLSSEEMKRRFQG